jgi:hypothetical protein
MNFLYALNCWLHNKNEEAFQLFQQLINHGILYQDFVKGIVNIYEMESKRKKKMERVK